MGHLHSLGSTISTLASWQLGQLIILFSEMLIFPTIFFFFQRPKKVVMGNREYFRIFNFSTWNLQSKVIVPHCNVELCHGTTVKEFTIFVRFTKYIGM